MKQPWLINLGGSPEIWLLNGTTPIEEPRDLLIWGSQSLLLFVPICCSALLGVILFLLLQSSWTALGWKCHLILMCL